MDKGILFDNYIDNLYKLKEKDHKVLSWIGKLLLNSLHGKFGTIPYFEEIHFSKTEEDLKYLINAGITHEKINFIGSDPKSSKTTLIAGNLYSLITPNLESTNPIILKNKENICLEYDTSLPIAMAIAAYARIHMHTFLKLYQDKLLYTDTDSIFITEPLDKKYLGFEKGKMKNILASSSSDYKIDNDNLFYYKKGVFVNDKVYALQTLDNEDIITHSGVEEARALKTFNQMLTSSKISFKRNCEDYKKNQGSTKSRRPILINEN